MKTQEQNRKITAVTYGNSSGFCNALHSTLQFLIQLDMWVSPHLICCINLICVNLSHAHTRTYLKPDFYGVQRESHKVCRTTSQSSTKHATGYRFYVFIRWHVSLSSSSCCRGKAFFETYDCFGPDCFGQKQCYLSSCFLLLFKFHLKLKNDPLWDETGSFAFYNPRTSFFAAASRQ